MIPTIGRRVHFTATVYGERKVVDQAELQETRESLAKHYEEERAFAEEAARALEDEGKGLSDEARAAKCAAAKAYLDEALLGIEAAAIEDEKNEALAMCLALESKSAVKAAVIVGVAPRVQNAGEDETSWIVDLETMPDHIVFFDVPFSAEPMKPKHWNWPA